MGRMWPGKQMITPLYFIIGKYGKNVKEERGKIKKMIESYVNAYNIKHFILQHI